MNDKIFRQNFVKNGFLQEIQIPADFTHETCRVVLENGKRYQYPVHRERDHGRVPRRTRQHLDFGDHDSYCVDHRSEV